jgi:hypothetical protein
VQLPPAEASLRRGSVDCGGAEVAESAHASATPRVPAIASTALPPQIFGVPYHRFKVGQTVVAPSGGPHALIPRGVHVIVRLLPLDGGEPQYRILSKVDGHERCVLESQIVPIEEKPEADEPPPGGDAKKNPAYRGRRYYWIVPGRHRPESIGPDRWRQWLTVTASRLVPSTGGRSRSGWPCGCARILLARAWRHHRLG